MIKPSKKLNLRRYLLDASCFGFLILIAVFAIFQPSDEIWRNLSLIFGGLLAALLMGAAGSYLLEKLNVETLGSVIFPDRIQSLSALNKRFPRFWLVQLFLFLIVTFVVGAIKTKASFTELFDEDGFNGAVRLFAGLLSPNMDVLPKALVNIIETVFMAFMATALAIPFAFVLSFLCARNIMKHPAAFAVYMFLRTGLNITRSIEALIWAIIFSVWVGIGPFAGMMALMIHSIASLAKQYSEMVESISEGPIEGIQSTGANVLQTIWFAVVPQVILPYISFTVYRWDINVRMATIIGLVGGGGIGTMLIQYQGQAMWPEVGCIILVIAVVVWMMDQASAYIREALK